MKSLAPIVFDYSACRAQLEEFRKLLASKPELSENADILPFFRERRQMCTLFGMFNPRIVWVDRFASEFDIFGDFACDIAVGEWTRGAYCFVEFEDAKKGSVFEKKGRATPEWGRRFDHGYSQVIDWMHKLAGRETSADNLARFGAYQINCEGILVIGRDAFQEPAEMERLAWRSDRVSVNQKKVICLTFDQLLSQFDTRMNGLAVVYELGFEKALASLASHPAPHPVSAAIE